MKLQFGRATRRGLAGLALLACVVARADAEDKTGAAPAATAPIPPRLPVEDFAQPQALFKVKMSPDGKHLGFLGAVEGRTALILFDLITMKSSTTQLGWLKSADREYVTSREITDFYWTGNERVVVDTVSGKHSSDTGLAGMNLDSSGWLGLTGQIRARSDVKGPRGQRLVSEMLQTSTDSPTRLLLLEVPKNKDAEHLDVVEMNTLTGEYRTLVQNPGDVVRWVPNERGEILAAIIKKADVVSVRYRPTPDAPWREWGALPVGKEWTLSGLRGNRLYLCRPAEDGRWSAYAYPMDKGPQDEQVVWHHPEYDFRPDSNTRDVGDSYLFAPDTGELLGVHYTTAGQETEWFSPRFAAIQEQLQKAHPDLSHTVLQLDQTGKLALILSRSARQAGIYSLLNLETMQLKQIATVRGWLRPEMMAEMYPIKLQARDGLPLSGYFTPPLGRGTKRLPTVVLVHDGPGWRDEWELDPQVQFLANRGYAVLQVNYRGTRGFGVKFSEAGRDSLGSAMANDINDAVRWAIKQGFVDETRIAVMGMGFGGTCALQAMAQEEGLYRAAAVLAPVTDWEDLYRRREHREYAFAYQHWVEVLPALADETLRRRANETAPARMAQRIRSPVFLAHGQFDAVVPYQQGMLLKSALRQAGTKFELFTPEFMRHRYPIGETGIEFLKKLEAFLAANLGAK